MEKQQLRFVLLARRKSFWLQQGGNCARLGQQLAEGARGLLAGLKPGDTVLSYLSFGWEPPTFALNQTILEGGFRLLVPFSFDAHQISWAQILPGCHDPELYGLKGLSSLKSRTGQQFSTAVAQLQGVALAFVPGLAVDTWGNRLGRGAGWYDRALARLRAKGNPALQVVGVLYQQEFYSGQLGDPDPAALAGAAEAPLAGALAGSDTLLPAAKSEKSSAEKPGHLRSAIPGSLPVEETDQRVDAVLTEGGFRPLVAFS